MSPADDSYLELLNPQQKEAVLHEGGPLLILAGAGSGKTRVITTRIAWLVREKGVPAESILAVTFTNKAAGEMQERVRRLCPGAGNLMVRTFHSFGAWLLRRYGTRVGLESGFTIYDDDDSKSLLKTILGKEAADRVSSCAWWISRAKDFGLGPDDDLSRISPDPDFAAVYRDYEKRLREIGNADFGDLILLPCRLLEGVPEVRSALQARFRTILVDEYQDSNIAQFRLLSALKGPGTSICVVGDDDQSIYRFRGAEVRNILDFPSHFPGTKIVRLEQNYRSTQTILDIAGAVVSRNLGRLGKALFTERAGGDPAVLHFFDEPEAEARFCAELLLRSPGVETAFLYRTNAQSRLFETTFTRCGIPYVLVGSLRFYEREEIKDALALLAFIVNPKDEVAFRRIVNKPARGIGEGSLEKILFRQAEAAGNYLEAGRLSLPDQTGKAAKGLKIFLDACDRLRAQLPGKPIAEWIRDALESAGLVGHYRDSDAAEGTERSANLAELVNAAAEYPPGTEGLATLLEHIELDRLREQASESGEIRVFLMTMHNTKGLEFDRVVITGLEDGVFPRGSDDEELEEERRLFYVALTRARNTLVLTSCRTRRMYGRLQAAGPSSFLSEIPEELLETKGGNLDAGAANWSTGTPVSVKGYGRGTIAGRWADGGEWYLSVRLAGGRTITVLPRYTPIEKLSKEDEWI